MQIEYKTGSFLDGPERFAVHGCNAQGKMASGAARFVRDQFPGSYDLYMQYHEKNDLTLGKTIWYADPRKVIIHAITQEFYGNDGRLYVDYDAVRTAFNSINLLAMAVTQIDGLVDLVGRIETVAMPKIGSGLAGGDWDTIAAIIEEEATAFQPVVYVL